MPQLIRIHPDDNVAVALEDVPAGTVFGGVTVPEPVPRGHKVALEAMGAGERVIKYGLPIGHTTAPLFPGHWVHTHNMTTVLCGESVYTYAP